MAKRPSIEKSAWFTPAQFGTESDVWCSIVCGSRKSRRLRASATTIADFPSGEKYMLYGSSTATSGPRRFPVVGSIGVNVPSVRPSALLVTQSVFRSHDGTTCCGLSPTSMVSTTRRVAGSITDTLFDFRFGTYTRSSAPFTASLSLFDAVSEYRLCGSVTGGMPGMVSTFAGAAVVAVVVEPGADVEVPAAVLV